MRVFVAVAAFLGILFGCVSSAAIKNIYKDETMELALAFSRQFLMHFNGLPATTDLKISGRIETLDISFPVLPPLPDPFFVGDSTLEFLQEPDSTIYGTLNGTNSSITGLSKLVDLFTISPTSAPVYELLLNYEISIPEFVLAGEHAGLLYLSLTDEPMEILSSGDYSVALGNLSLGLTLQVKVLLENALSISSVSLDLGFDALEVSTTETTIDGSEIDWVEFSSGITAFFPVLWEQIKPQIDALLQLALNLLLGDCKLTDLVNGDLTCITGEPESTESPLGIATAQLLHFFK